MLIRYRSIKDLGERDLIKFLIKFITRKIK